MERQKTKYQSLATEIKKDRSAAQIKAIASMRHTKDFGESVGSTAERVTVTVSSPVLIEKILEGEPVKLNQSTRENLKNSASFQAAFWAKAHQKGMSTKDAQVAWNAVFGAHDEVSQIKTQEDDKRFKKTKFYS